MPSERARSSMSARAAMLVGCAWLFAPAALVAQEDIQQSIRESQQRLEAIREERANLQGEMTELAGQVHTISEEIENLEL